VPTSALIALRGVRDEGRVCAGQSVLVNGAGGGVGTFAVQLAKAYGAEVTGVDATGKLDLIRSIGADHVIDSTEEDFAEGPRRFDVIIDIPGNRPFSGCRRALTPEGAYVLIGHDGFGAMRALGADDAVNLDGGGSTTMLVRGTLVTRPSDATGERPIADAVLIRSLSGCGQSGGGGVLGWRLPSACPEGASASSGSRKLSSPRG
jgi:NADPH:quinone reductase-like Zn-dependent oxidoreductase